MATNFASKSIGRSTPISNICYRRCGERRVRGSTSWRWIQRKPDVSAWPSTLGLLGRPISTRRLGAVPWCNVLDVAGGTGAFSITLCHANSELRATILDYPNVCDVAAVYV